MRIETFLRQNDHWVLREAAGPGATITFESIARTIALVDVCAKIDWSEEISGASI